MNRLRQIPYTILRIKSQFYPPPANCVLYLPGYPPLGSTIHDRSGSSPPNNGAIAGATWATGGKNLRCLSFDGNDKVDCGIDASLQIQNGTILYWVKQLATVAYQGCIATATSTGLKGYRSGISNNGVVEVLIGDDTTFNQALGTTVMDDNKWRLAAGTFSATFLTVYVNGVAEGTPVARTKTITFLNTLKIGAWADLASYFVGSIALPRIFNVALSADQILNIYNQERHLF